MTKTMRCKGFTITRRANGTFKVKYVDCNNRTWECECKNFREAGDYVWNIADNHDIGSEVNHKMCERFDARFFS